MGVGLFAGLFVSSDRGTTTLATTGEGGREAVPVIFAEKAEDFCFGKVSVIVFLAVNVLLIVFVGWFCRRVGGAKSTRAAVRACNPKKTFNLHPPIIMMPEKDVEAGNGIEEVCFGQVDEGVEVTIVFADEDRPNKCEDFIYDHIR